MVTKENVAAHEIAEHLVALQLLAQQLMGRLVGYYEQRRVENRNHHTRQKSLLIGCGGAFNRNVDSHIAQCLTGSSRLTWCWRTRVNNMVTWRKLQQQRVLHAPVSKFGLVTTGIYQEDLQQTEEAKFRRKLLKRPLALRSPTHCDSNSVKTTHERCGPFSLVVLSQRRGRVTTSSGPTLSETLSSKTLQVS